MTTEREEETRDHQLEVRADQLPAAGGVQRSASGPPRAPDRVSESADWCTRQDGDMCDRCKPILAPLPASPNVGAARWAVQPKGETAVS